MPSSSCFCPKSLLCRGIAAISLLYGCLHPAFAKTPELAAIEVYPNGGSMAYVQISGFALNAKNEVHLCAGATSINRNSYGKLPRIALAAGMSLERAKDGMLLLDRGGAAECVVPGNLKLEKAEGQTPSELADKAEVTGQVQAASIASTAGIPIIAPGVKIVLVSALDSELAEFLLAQRSGTLKAWQSYVSKYPATLHAAQAKAAISALFVQQGDTELAAYRSSLNAPQPNYGELQAAKSSLDSAMAKVPSNPASDALAQGIQQETKAINNKGLAEIALYRTAAANQTKGYSHFTAAYALSQISLNLDQKAPETVALDQACTQERTILDDHFVSFQMKLSASRPDEAYTAIQPLLSFAAEDPRVPAALHSLYTYHVVQARKCADKGDPEGEVVEFQKAARAEPGAEIDRQVAAAQQQAKESADKTAVTMAMTMSQGAEDDKDFVKAYEVLDNLTPDQRKMVSERMELLKDRYVATASKKAVELQHTYLPIKGIADERGVEHAYSLLRSCYALTSDPALQDHISTLADSLSDYYLAQAKHYLALDYGTGTNLGYAYLLQALPYKASNQGDIRAELTRANAAHQLRSRLSLKVEFRDGTSRREATDFADQLTDALATGLETSNHDLIKVVRPKETTAVPPNFSLTGDVLQHTKSNAVVARTGKTSRYRSGEHDVVTDGWSAVNRQYEAANQEKATADASLQGAIARGKKNLIADARRQDTEAQQKVAALRLKLDSTQKFQSEQIERPYTYTEQVNHLTATVELQFTVVDSVGHIVIPLVRIPNTETKDYTTLEKVEPQDTMGVRIEGEIPTENQFMEKVEYDARDSLLKQANEQARNLLPLILESADRKAMDGDTDGAAEQYILYLNATGGTTTPERQRAQKFLLENYNFHGYGGSAPNA